MTAINATRRQAGFTIIELVVVILLLGILTATALPRFMDVTDEAHEAVVDAVEGGFTTGLALFRAQWFAEGQPVTSVVSEFNMFASALTGVGKTKGYPIGYNPETDEDTCHDVYRGLLQPGGRPEATLITLAATSTTGANELELETFTANNPAVAIAAATLTGPTDLTDGELCHYYYVGQHKNGSAANPVNIPYIIYNFRTGAVTRGTLLLNT